jgi:PAS domain S-box-containing protein
VKQRTKIHIFIIVSLVMVSMLGGGAIYLFAHMGDRLEEMVLSVSLVELHDRLEAELDKTAGLVVKISYIDDPALVSQYRAHRALIVSILSEISTAESLTTDATLAGLINRYFELADRIIAAHGNTPPAEISALRTLTKEVEQSIVQQAREQHDRTMRHSLEIVQSSVTLKNTLLYYLALLVGFSVALSALMLLMLRRMVEEPYRILLEATEHVTAGDFVHRIGSGRQDEFGLISRRFDGMVESLAQHDVALKRRLNESELLLSVLRMADLKPGMSAVLTRIADAIAVKLERDFCAVLLRDDHTGFFEMAAHNGTFHCDAFAVPIASSQVLAAIESGAPVLVSSDEIEQYGQTCHGLASMVLAPVFFEHRASALLLIGESTQWGATRGDFAIAGVLAQTVGTIVMNFKLHGETRTQLEQIRAINELSTAIAGLYDTDELLSTIAARTASLLKAEACFIRMIEGGMLVIRSHFGIAPDEMLAPLKVGEGIPGMVAQDGESVLIEDITDLPERPVKSGNARTVVSVPLKVGGKTIGTLGLHNKMDLAGRPVAFDRRDLNIAEGFASISAIAIEKTRMREREQRIEIERLKTEERMRLLFESVQSGIVTLDRDFTVLSANKYIERWADRPVDEILLRNAREIFHDRSGICPHCAAVATLKDGSVNTITQSSGLNYADLSSYPVRDESGEVVEAIVFIQDITDRVLYQEEIMGLYREVMQSKDYIESLINNSADAIVTMDLNGLVRSWNKSAEAIYGFQRAEVEGAFVPYVPETLMESEREYIERIRRGEVVQSETFRKRKDGSLIETSMTMSPIKDISGEIIGISTITRDITDKKRVEKELIRRNQELSRLFFISSAMRGTLELDRVLRMVLTAVTMSDGLGFNRAVLFLRSAETGEFRAAMGIGPASHEEAGRIWGRLSERRLTLQELMHDIEEGPLDTDTLLEHIGRPLIAVPGDGSLVADTADRHTPINVTNVSAQYPGDEILGRVLHSESCATVPLIWRDKVIGVMWVDNVFTRRSITPDDITFLTGFADQVAAAIEAARLFKKVSLAEAELENIFASISDMVYMTDRDYTVRNVNKAVLDRLGLTREAVIGRKCYQVFHGTEEPHPQCPHHDTVQNMRSVIKEVEDTYLRGTFLSSTAPMFNEKGNFLATVHVVRDVSELKSLREKLQSAERKAALGEVAAKVAHEIRNPLVSVGGFAKRLEKLLEGEQQEFASIIADEVGRLESILKDILGFVREVRLNSQSVDLNEIVRSVLDLVDTEILKSGNTLVRAMSGNPLPLYVDPDRVREAILNIVVNANQFTTNGQIAIRTGSEGGANVLEVDDTGLGIGDGDLQRVFDPFYTTRAMGTGLGLAVTKRIIEENEGSIEIIRKTHPQQGTIFRIVFPAVGPKEDA